MSSQAEGRTIKGDEMNRIRESVNNPPEESGNTAPDFLQLTRLIKVWAKELGFQEVRVAHAKADMTESEHGLQQWLSEGYQGEMDYMAKHGSRRTRPEELVPGTVRVISLRLNYMPAAADSWKVILNGNKAFISRYALGRDYHKVLRTHLQKLAERISAKVEHFNYRVFTDSAPVVEVEWAQKAGVGWRASILYFCRVMPGRCCGACERTCAVGVAKPR
jgi:epoxyqueuosine reductase